MLGLLILSSVKRWAFQVALVVKNLPANAGDVRDVGLIPGLGRYLTGGHGKPGGLPWGSGVAKSQTRLSD